jgi:Zn-dependent peptidase ImmA (M78 family)
LDRELFDRCLILAEEMAAVYEANNPPFLLNKVLEKYGVLEVRSRLLNRDARLVLENGSPIIEVNPLFPKVRRRLSIAHEIGHMMLNDCAGRDRFEISHGTPSEEALCNQIAGLLLVPETALREFFENRIGICDWKDPICCSGVLEAARRFEVSVDVMARRIFRDLALAPSKIAIIWRAKTGATSCTHRIASAWHSIPEGVFIPRNKSAPRTSVVYEAMGATDTLFREESLDLGNLRGKFVIEAKGYGSSEDQACLRSVLTIVEL